MLWIAAALVAAGCSRDGNYTPLPKKLPRPDEGHHAAAQGERIFDRRDQSKSTPATKLPD